MAKKKTRRMSRKELKEKDQVLTSLEKGWQFVEKHAHKVVALLVGGVLVSAVWALWSHFSYKSKASASRLFNRAMRAYNAPVLPGGGDIPGAEKKKSKDGVKDSYPTAEARAKAALKLFNKMLSEHDDHSLALTARFYRANCYFQLGQNGRAIKDYKKFLAAEAGKGCGGQTTRPEALEVLALENLGYAYEASGEYDQALNYFKKLESAVAGIKKEWAIYHQARMWQLKGNLTRAIALYRRVKQADRHASLSPLRPLSEKRAAYLEMGEKIDKLRAGGPKGGPGGKDKDADKGKGSGDREPAAVTRKPAAEADRPAGGARKPAAGARKPAAGARKPAAGARKPTVGARKSAAGTRKPAGAARKTRPAMTRKAAGTK